LLNVIDDCNREGLAIDADLSLPAERVKRLLDKIIKWRREPNKIRSDNGPEYISHSLGNGVKEHDIKLLFIQPGNPQQNAYVELFNRTVCYDLLGHYLFESIQDVQQYVTNWLWTYNLERPNTGIGGITPKKDTGVSCMEIIKTLIVIRC
jgi:putative transposase